MGSAYQRYSSSLDRNLGSKYSAGFLWLLGLGLINGELRGRYLSVDRGLPDGWLSCTVCCSLKAQENVWCAFCFISSLSGKAAVRCSKADRVLRRCGGFAIGKVQGAAAHGSQKVPTVPEGSVEAEWTSAPRAPVVHLWDVVW